MGRLTNYVSFSGGGGSTQNLTSTLGGGGGGEKSDVDTRGVAEKFGDVICGKLLLSLVTLHFACRYPFRFWCFSSGRVTSLKFWISANKNEGDMR